MNNDIISRQTALDALERIFDRCEEIEAHLPDGDPDKTGYKMFPDYMTVWKYLHQLPSAERRGLWKRIIEDPPVYACTECGMTICTYNLDRYPYCNCGARMEATE